MAENSDSIESIHEMDNIRLSIPPDEVHKTPSLTNPRGLTQSLELPELYEELKQKEEIKLKKRKGKRRWGKKTAKGESIKEPGEKMLYEEHKWSKEELVERLQTDINWEEPRNSRGLSLDEIPKRQAQYGLNQLSPGKVTPMWVKFLLQFVQFFPLLLEAGGTLCLIAYGLDSSVPDNLYLGVILWLVVIITAVFSFMQESKSASVMEGFKKLAPQTCKVHRGGKVYELDAKELVPGDIVEIKAGDKIPADIRLLEVSNLKVDNSSLTGESEPQSRSTECSDDNPLETKNLAFFSTLAQEGDGIGVVIRTGDNTIIGNIAGLASSTKNEDTPLHREIARFIKIVSTVAISLGIIFLIVGFVVGLEVVPNIVFVIGIIVANVPEGLLPTVTVSLTLTAKRLATKNVLVKNLEAVETLGSCSTICSDKTGTLTQNRMTVVHLWYDGRIWTVDQLASSGYFDSNAPSFIPLQRIATLCNRAVFDSDSENMKKDILQRKTIGDASESALIKFCEPLRNIEEYRNSNPKIFEIPFNSANKWQLSIHEDMDNRNSTFLVIKGAPERIISRCDKIYMDGDVVPLTEDHKKKFESAYETLAGHGERVLGFAELRLDESFTPKFEFDAEKKNFPTDGLVFAGLIALMDPPKDTVPQAVALCKQAGVRVIMVTGDHPLTAAAIARQVGILEGETIYDIAKKEGIPVDQVNPDRAPAAVIKGAELEDMSEEDWNRVLSKNQIVFARTSPEQKLQIVEHCQKRGEIVAVTGDGVNDSPALKKADLGCAMGISGSDVSKEAADIILLDDNFASIVTGIEEGRIIFDNLKKSIAYTLSSNSAELVPFILFIVAQMPLALSAVLILCIDLGTDLVPAISLAYEHPESDIMRRAPRNPKKDRLVTLRLAIYSYIWLGTIQAVAGFIAYFVVMNDYGFAPNEVVGISFEYFRRNAPDIGGFTADEQLDILAEAQTAFFVAVVVTRIGCVISCKTRRKSIFTRHFFENTALDFGILTEIALVVLLTYVPIFHIIFNTRPLTWKPWVIGIPFFIFVVLVENTRKWFCRTYPGTFLDRTLW